jgi:hypothetical protein
MMPDWAPIDTAPMPPGAVRVNLPASEVCMHLALAGRDRWVAKLDDHTAQIYDDGGAPYSAPVLLSEAGLTGDGAPMGLCDPTCSALTFKPRTPYDGAGNWRLVVADDVDVAAVGLLLEPWLDAAPAFTPEEVGLTPAEVSPTVAFIPSSRRDFGLMIEPVHEQPTAPVTFTQLCARLARCWSRPLPGNPELAIVRATIPVGSSESSDGTKHRVARWPIGEATPIAMGLRHAGWIVHVVVEHGRFALLARRRLRDIHAAVAELVALDVHGWLDLADPTETRTLARAELAAGTRHDRARC